MTAPDWRSQSGKTTAARIGHDGCVQRGAKGAAVRWGGPVATARRRVVALLRKAAVLADEYDLTLGNGGEVGSLAGTMADELELMK